jgi:hypothetical protein
MVQLIKSFLLSYFTCFFVVKKLNRDSQFSCKTGDVWFLVLHKGSVFKRKLLK